LDTITVVGLGVTGKSFFVYAQKFSAGLCIFPLQSSALLFCHTQSKLNQVNNSSLVKFIASSYKDIFRYNNKYFKSGVKDLTIQLIIKFYNVFIKIVIIFF